jgi:hypothetical protein
LSSGGNTGLSIAYWVDVLIHLNGHGRFNLLYDRGAFGISAIPCMLIITFCLLGLGYSISNGFSNFTISDLIIREPPRM